MDEAGRLEQQPVKEVVRRGADVIVRLSGELDLYNASVVREALAAVVDSSPQRIVVDLGDVSFIDSTALGVLLEARARLPRKDAFVLAEPGAETRRTLQVSGLDRQIRVAESVDDALATG